MPVSAACAALAEAWRASALAELDSAEVLRGTGRNWAQVYWHAGMAVEQMLKAIRIKRDGLEGEWPAGDQSSAWHDLEFVADKAGMRDEFRLAGKGNRTFEANWLTVRDWDHRRRYPDLPDAEEAREMLLAVVNRTQGVMQWLQLTYQRI